MDRVTAREQMLELYRQVRQRSVCLSAPLSAEDQCVQSMADTSPTKWHLGHTTWFFEVFVLLPYFSAYSCYSPGYHYLFNSYYETHGHRHPRPQRGLLTRPAHQDVMEFRRYVDDQMQRFLLDCSPEQWQKMQILVELGLQHEQQHQELMLTDILHAFYCNPLLPTYDNEYPSGNAPSSVSGEKKWVVLSGGIFTVGHDGDSFGFDSEKPQHPVVLQPFELSSHLVSCDEYLHFVEDGGYQRPEFWLAEGWTRVQEEHWQAPLYWIAPGDFRAPSSVWQVFSLSGLKPLSAGLPVMNLSFFEACAFAQWANARLPTEFEWEVACARHDMQQRFCSAWQWTRSAYEPYPGFRPMSGAASEYNGKFMVSQQVLRGGSHATAPGHSRLTYRNFFPPSARWQFSGIRLARG